VESVSRTITTVRVEPSLSEWKSNTADALTRAD